MVEAKPLISVVCCTHNREAFAIEHLRALQSHLGEDVELIYALDNCTDNSLTALQTLAAGHPKVRVLEHKGERGLFNCRNFALSHVRGKFVHFLDDDDGVEPGFYAHIVKELAQEANGNIDLYLARLQVSLPDGSVSDRTVMEIELLDEFQHQQEVQQLSGDLFLPILRGQIYYAPCNAVIRRDLFVRHPFNKAFRKSADWLFILEAALHGPLSIKYDKRVAANYIVHANSMSIGPDKAIWNAKVFETLLDQCVQQQRHVAEVERVYAESNFHAGYSLRLLSPKRALGYYFSALKFGLYGKSLLGMLKLPINLIQASRRTEA